MDRCAVLVDAGYLLGAAGTLLARDPERTRLVVDYPTLVAALIAEAEKQTTLPVLRMLWYDGAVRGQPTPEHRTLRVLPDVKVRLGETVRRAGRLEQKGVDSYLQRDLTTLARNRAVSDVVLIGGDEDLRRGLEEAQDYGVRVHLWGVEAAEPEYNQSQALIAEADRRWVISEYWVRQYVSLATSVEPPAAPTGLGYRSASLGGFPEIRPPDVRFVESRFAEGESMDRAGGYGSLGEPRSADERRSVDEHRQSHQHRTESEHDALDNHPLDDHDDTAPSLSGTPAELARLHHPPHPAGPISGRSATRPSPSLPAPARQLPRLRELTTPAQAWQDNEADALAATGDPVQTGATFGERWASRATRSQYQELLAQRPMLPNRIDGELLRYADRLGMDTRENELAKHIVRDSFWDGMLSATPKDDPAEAPSAGRQSGSDHSASADRSPAASATESSQSASADSGAESDTADTADLADPSE
jgi:uncharacterized LabA/DUF88 family protein